MADKCKECKGTKDHAPLGGINVKCAACKGVGYIVIEDNAVIHDKVEKEACSEAVQKKRGRPKASD